jgi:AcrR family transcriptional regulator
MALKTRTEAEKELRRRFVLDAARRVLTHQGIDSTSMEDIAAAVDYTRRTLYTYFKSRDEILLQVHTEDLRARWSLQKAAIESERTGLTKIRRWAEVLYRFCCDNPQTVQLQQYWDYRGVERKRITPDVFAEFESINEELAGALRMMFRQGVVDGSLRPDLEIDITISQFLYSLRAVIHRALARTYSFAHFDSSRYFEHYLDLFVRAIRKPGDRYE